MTALSLHTPATQADLADCAGLTTAQLWALARVQVRLGQSWALRRGETCMACGGWVPAGDRGAEGWLMMRPEAGALVWLLLRCVRLTLQASPYLHHIVLVSTPQGRLIARRLGFRLADTRSDGLEVWRS